MRSTCGNARKNLSNSLYEPFYLVSCKINCPNMIKKK